jgi:hypothetical protein
MDFQQLLAKLGRTGQVQAGAGLLAFILSFFAWATVSFTISPDEAALLKAAGQPVPSDSYSQNAWGSYTGFTAWFPVILLLALAVIAVLVTLGTIKPLPMALIGVLTGGLATLVILIRWLTYDTGVGGGWALFVTLVLALGVTAVSYMGMAAEGSSFATITSALQGAGGGGQQPPTPPQS